MYLQSFQSLAVTELGTAISVKGQPVGARVAGTGGSTDSGCAEEPVSFACHGSFRGRWWAA